MLTGDEAQTNLAQINVDIRRLSIPTVAQLRTARDSNSSPDGPLNGPEAFRKLVVVRLTTPEGEVGWGECSALNTVGYTDESAATSFALLTKTRSPNAQLFPMAAAAMEMARLDLRLRGQARSLASVLNRSASASASATVRAGAALGLMPVDDAVREVAQLRDEGYSRVKVKIEPASVTIVPAALRSTFPDLEIQVDANGSLDLEHLDELVALSDLGVSAIEQPFATNRPDLAATLISRIGIPVVADEAVPNLSAAQEIHRAGALTGVSIKPARVGGLANALELLSWCVNEGVSATAGGMLECSLGRHSLAAFAACDGLNLTGDLSPSRRWLQVDPWPDLVMNNGLIAVPQTTGVAPLPDQGLIETLTEQRWSGSYTS